MKKGKFKRKLSKFLAVAFVASLMTQPEITVFAAAPQEILESTETPTDSEKEEEITKEEESTEVPTDSEKEEETTKEIESTEVPTDSEKEEETTKEIESTEVPTDSEKEEETTKEIESTEVPTDSEKEEETTKEEESTEVPTDSEKEEETTKEIESTEVPTDSEKEEETTKEVESTEVPTDSEKEEETTKEVESTEVPTDSEKEEETTKEVESMEVPTDSEKEEETIKEIESTEVPTDSEEENITPFSLLPLEEVDAYLVLNDYSEEEIKEIPLETILSRLQDSEGKSIEIPEDANVVWAYFKDENGNILHDEYHVIGRGDKVDLSNYIEEVEYTMELIIGSGKQLDADSIRYIVTVYISDISEYISYDLFKENESGNRSRVWDDEIISRSSSILDDINMPVVSVSFIPSSYNEEDSYYLGIDSSVAKEPWRQGIKVDIYPMKKFLECYQNGNPLSGAITDQILNQEDMYDEGGYPGKYTVPDKSKNILDADNIFCIVYTDAENGKILAYQGLIFSVQPNILDVTGKIFSYEDGQMKDITEKAYSYNRDSVHWEIDLTSESNGVIIDYYTGEKNYYLVEGYRSNAEYYYVLDENEHIEKVVLGEFDTPKEAEEAGAEDITDKILPADRSKMPYGYLANYYMKNYYFTVFFDDSTAIKYDVDVYGNTNSSSSSNTVYDPAPSVNKTDPYFRMNGANGYNKYKNLYIVQNSYDTTLDTLYSYGYQTLFINDENANLAELKPTFWCPEDVKVHVGEEQISGVSVQDFSKGAVYYAVHIGDKLKNYQVTFAKKEKGSKLFVNGPSEREIFLDEYFEGRHDILIANIGSEELTGLKVELLDAVNVKLDDYWVVGGEKNDTLAAFDEVDSDSSYGELPNLAKIRLLPTGEGDVKGTLKISADGQEDVYIKLTGHAGNPKIITESLSDGVKYVPYSYVVATNNMHDWNKVTFSISKGKLPKGLELYPATGEIYGVPLESGTFPITVKATYSRKAYTPSYAEFTLVVNENTNHNVYNSSDEGYEIKTYIGTEAAIDTRDYLLESISDQVFVSSGEYNEFIDLWLNGEKLIEGEDYIKDKGSTKITIRSQTFKDKTDSGSNTIAAEFRVNGDKSRELKRTAQNFRFDIPESNDNNKSENNNESNNNSTSSNNTTSNNNNASSSNSTSNNNTTSNNNSTSNNTTSNNENKDNIIISYNDDSWVKENTGWRCKMPSGSWLTNTWHQLPYKGTNEWYYFNEQGYMATGWIEDKGQWYYLNPISDGTQGKMYTDWQFIDGKWCYFNEKGALTTNTWYQLPYKGTNEWYYFNEQGYMATGWMKDKGQWYYLNPTSDGTQGKMYTGWQFINGNWYYFNTISNGTKGALVTNAWIGDYYVNENGIWVE